MSQEITVTDRSHRIAVAAARLRTASASGFPCAPVRDVLGANDVEAAYEVQQINVRAQLVQRSARVVGRKIGLTSKAVQSQIGVDQPDFGVLLDDMHVPSTSEVPSGRLLQPRAEVEIAFVLACDMEVDVQSLEEVRGCVDYAVAAIEIVDSRITDWDISITDTVADNASSGLYVLGERLVGLEEFEPREVRMQMSVDGVPASVGTGEACLGEPLLALQWLARTAIRYGDPLRAGQVVLSGALGPLVPTPPGTQVRAELSSLGPVVAQFSREETP